MGVLIIILAVVAIGFVLAKTDKKEADKQAYAEYLIRECGVHKDFAYGRAHHELNR